jgi:hypothetical protein
VKRLANLARERALSRPCFPVNHSGLAEAIDPVEAPMWGFERRSKRSPGRGVPAGPAIGRRLAGEAALPLTADGDLVLSWETLNRHLLILGASGMGKTETSLRIAEQLALCTDAQIFYLDGKGNRAGAARFGALMAACGRRAHVFPNEPFAGWRGDWNAVMNRLLEVIEYAETGPAAYYRDQAKVVLALVCRDPAGPPASSEELLERIDLEYLTRAYPGRRGIDALSATQVREIRGRYEAFFANLGTALDGEWGWDDSDAGYFLLDPLALREDAAGATSLLFTDFGHYISKRKDPERPCVLFIDEFSSIARRNDIAFVTEQARSFNVGLVLIPQSLSGLGDEEQRDRIIDSVETVIAHACRLPDRVSALGGERKVAELNHRFGDGVGESEGHARLELRPKVEPQELRTLPIGSAWVMRRGRATKMRVERAAAGAAFELPPAQDLYPEEVPRDSAAPKELGYLDGI